ncbi:MAG: GNAT family N-acetyltransferase [Pseudomonadota bacterium]
MDISIQDWQQPVDEWPALSALVKRLDQVRWVSNSYFDWHLDRHLYVATSEDEPIGYILSIIQYIGDDERHDRVELDGQALKEAKILAFGVPPERRGQGIGRQLQLFAMEAAYEEGCYQFRSRSDGEAIENHILKKKMGFAIHPANRGEDRTSVFFVMPLRIWKQSQMLDQ